MSKVLNQLIYSVPGIQCRASSPPCARGQQGGKCPTIVIYRRTWNARLVFPKRPNDSYYNLHTILGKTGFYGLELVGKPKKGETIYVSSGASAVGS